MGYTHGTSIDSKIRTCTECNKEYPNTNEYFTYANKKLGRLSSVCKTCQAKISKEKRLKTIEKIKGKICSIRVLDIVKIVGVIYQIINCIFQLIYHVKTD